MRITSRMTTFILVIVFFMGISVLLYPVFSQYWNGRVQAQAVADYENYTNKLSEEDYKETLERASDYNKRLAGLKSPMTQYKDLNDYTDVLDVNGYGMMGYVAIDKLRVELPVYHGTDASVLGSACGHMEGTSLPVGGRSTHAVLSAHRGLPTAKLFTDLDKMQVGDTFCVNVLNQSCCYEVDQVKIVEPSDASDLVIEEGKDYVTLVTCTPYGINSHRLLVRGHRIRSDELPSSFINAEAYRIDRLVVTPFVALPMLFILFVYVIFKPVKKNFREERVNDFKKN